MENEQIKKRKEKIINWLKNPYNFGLFAIIVFALIIRLYYFIMTLNQPLWWDEAVYMDMARSIAFNLPYRFDPVRPLMFPLITAFFMKLGDTEFLSRLLMLVFSMASVIGVYLLGNEFYNKKIGLLAGFLMSVFYLNLFFSYRILIDIPSLVFFTFSALFFLKYFKTNSNKMLYIASILIGIGALFRMTTAVLLFAVLVYLLITEKLKIIWKKELWIAALIFFLILSPYIIWGYFQFHGNVITLAGARNAPKTTLVGFTTLAGYIKLFPTYFSLDRVQSLISPGFLGFLILIVLLIPLLYKLILGFDLLVYKNEPHLKKDFFLFLIIIIPLISMSFLLDHNEDRYIFAFFPAAFIILSFILISLYTFVSKKNKFFAIVLIILLIVFIGYSQIKAGDSLIKNKLPSYKEVEEAGLWLKQNSAPGDYIVTNSYQIRYYSKRERIGFPENKSDFLKMFPNNSIKYFVMSGFESHPEWSYSYPQEANLTPIQAYFADLNKQNPVLIIYRL